MVITQGQLIEVVNDYIETDILVHTNKMSSVEQLIFGIKVGMFKRSVPKLITNYLDVPEMKLLGVVTDNGVDLDIIYESALDSIRKIGTVEYGNLRFTENDITKLYNIAKAKGGCDA